MGSLMTNGRPRFFTFSLPGVATRAKSTAPSRSGVAGLNAIATVLGGGSIDELEGPLMNFFRRRALAFALFFGLLSSAWEILEAQTLRVPYVSLSPTAGPLWIAYEAGFFKRNNVSAELLYIPGGSTIIQAIISGDVRIANMAPPSAIGAWAKGFDLVLIASGVDQLLETVVTGPAIKSPADLKNKKIGVSRYGSLTDMALREALRHYNLNPDKDVTILQTGGEATRFAALTTGAIDGAMLSEIN